MKMTHPEEALEGGSRRTHRCHSQALWKPRGGRPEERAKSTHSFRSSEPAGLVDEVAQRLAGEESAAVVEDDLVAAVVGRRGGAGRVGGQHPAGGGASPCGGRGAPP